LEFTRTNLGFAWWTKYEEGEMDIGKAFTFVFDDKDWVVKVLIGIGILVAGLVLSWLIVPAILAGLLLSGYALEITRRVIRGEVEVLPAWEDWGQLLIDGLQVAVIGVVYALPMIIMSACVGAPLQWLSEGSEVASGFFGFAVGCVNFLWAIVLSLVLPAAIAKFAAEGELAAAFQFGDVIALVRDNLATYVITAVMVWVTGIIASLGLLLCFIGVFFTAVYAQLVNGYLYGQAYLEATGNTPQVISGEAAP
jgi:hypothetical protein